MRAAGWLILGSVFFSISACGGSTNDDHTTFSGTLAPQPDVPSLEPGFGSGGTSSATGGATSGVGGSFGAGGSSTAGGATSNDGGSDMGGSRGE